MTRISSVESSFDIFMIVYPQDGSRDNWSDYPNLGYPGQGGYCREMSKPKFTKADEIFRELLKGLRTSKRLTQTGLADRLGHPQSYVSKYETGERRLDFVETVLVCEALGEDVAQFAATFAKELARNRRPRGA